MDRVRYYRHLLIRMRKSIFSDLFMIYSITQLLVVLEQNIGRFVIRVL